MHFYGKYLGLILIGTDHPFFPPLHDEDEKWPSVTTNYRVIRDCFGEGNPEVVDMVLGGNANRILKLGLD